jgi:hypothetical protein
MGPRLWRSGATNRMGPRQGRSGTASVAFSRTLMLVVAVSAAAMADKVIMKDGKIYEGRIMGETSRSLLISNAPLDPKPRFVELKDVMTIVRESRPPDAPSPETGRFASLFALLTGSVFTSSTFSLSPAPGLELGGAFRVHPALELSGAFDWNPTLSGEVAVTDGQNTRGYEKFFAYGGGFSLKIFPLFRFRGWRAEPYLTTGYHWSRLVPKASDDAFKGSALRGGAGMQIRWWRPLYWDLAVLYQHTRYDRVKFLAGEGDISDVRNDSVTFSAGLSYRFL